MFNLHELAPLVKKRKRVGRGGKLGGTSGKGHKGQKARSGGKVYIGFEGGQMPLYRRLPKRGFTNAPHKLNVEIVNLSALKGLQEREITPELMIEKGIIKPKKNQSFYVKVLGNGSLDKPVTVVADFFSAGARVAIEQAGGKAVTKNG